VEGVNAVLRLDAPAIGPVEATMHRMGPGHFVAHGFAMPAAGAWKIELTIRRDQAEPVRVAATLLVR